MRRSDGQRSVRDSAAQASLLGVIVGSLVLSVPGYAVEPETAADATSEVANSESPNRDAEAPVALDRLLKLPSSYSTRGPRRGGIERGEWQARFTEARGEVTAKNAELDRLQKKLAGLASGGAQWQAGAPGLSNSDSQHQTLSYKLRQDLRGARSGIVDAERGLLELGVQADLAGVPPEWRE